MSAAATDREPTQRLPVRKGTTGADRAEVLDIHDLSIVYKGTPAVRGVDLTVRRGEVVGLIGESGSGKSSIALACLGLLGPEAGVTAERIDVCGTDLRGADAKRLAHLRGSDVAMVFQDAMGALDPTMRVGIQLREVVRRHRGLDRKAARDTVLELLTMVGIPEPERRARQYPHQLSGGLRQRTAIALALAGSPKLLLADEPTTALDVTVQAGILRLFRKIRDELDVGILLISHDIGVIAQTADRVGVMLNGEIVEQGDVRAVLSTPRNEYTRRLLQSVPTVDRGRIADEPESAPAGAKPIKVSVRDVTRTYGSRSRPIHALRPVDLDIEEGEVLGVVGESGSGKSTLAKLLVHLEEASTGRVTVDDLDFARLRGAQRRRFRRAIQMVFQHPAGSLNPRLKVGLSIREPLGAADVDSATGKKRVSEVLREVGLDPSYATRLPHELSGGQKQRVAIGRAIAGEPSVVVLDEPTSALDVSVQAQVLELLAGVQRRRNLTFVFISHNLAVVRTISDRVAVMYAGRIVELAAAQDLFDHPKHWYTAELLAAVPSVVPPPRSDENHAVTPEPAASAPAPSQLVAEIGCAFAPRCPAADDLCRSTLPPLVEVQGRHRVACHHPRPDVAVGTTT